MTNDEVRRENPIELLERLNPRINLAFGSPNYGISDSLVRSACEAVRAGYNNYTPAVGDIELREALWRGAAGAARIPSVPRPLICAGAGAGIACSLLALFRHGGELIMVDPFFVQ